MTDSRHGVNKPYDFAFARLSRWLQAMGLTMHTDIKGHSVFRVKETREIWQ